MPMNPQRREWEKRRRQEAADQARAMIQQNLTIGIASALRDGIVKGYFRVNEDFSRYLSTILPTPAEMEEMNLQVARRARRSVEFSYNQRVTARQSALSRTHYRSGPGGGRLGGALRKLIKDESAMFQVSSHGIRFIDVQRFDQEAAHWYRLNFGAGPRGQSSVQGTFTMIFGGETVGTIGFNTGPSLSPVIMPAGFFIDGSGARVGRSGARRGQDAFYLRSKNKVGAAAGVGGMGVRGRALQRRVTAGIEARNFLDAGVRTIARELPKAYDDYFRNKAASTQGITIEKMDELVKSPKYRIRYPTKTSKFPARFSRGLPK